MPAARKIGASHAKRQTRTRYLYQIDECTMITKQIERRESVSAGAWRRLGKASLHMHM